MSTLTRRPLLAWLATAPLLATAQQGDDAFTGRLRAGACVVLLITSGNTNSPTLMIAEKAAEWIQAGA